jgi:pilus assembly protein Flp/PilA
MNWKKIVASYVTSGIKWLPLVTRLPLHGDENMLRVIRKFVRNEQAATMIEYALIAALVSVAAVVILGSLGKSVSNVFSTVNTAMSV